MAIDTSDTGELTAWDRWRPLLVFGLTTSLVSVLGSIATNSSVNSEWFENLAKPAFYPPGALFGIAWTILYLLVAVAGWLAWRNGGGMNVLVPWTIQLVLNLGWSVTFFGMRNPPLGLVVIVGLLVVIGWALVSMWRYSHWAAYLFIPYLLWVGFATVLNAAIVAMN